MRLLIFCLGGGRMYKKHLLRNAVGITFGSIIFAMGYAWFLIPFKIAPGGVGGLSQIFFHLYHVPAGVSMLIFNIPLLVLGLKLVGKQFGLGTLYGMLLGAIFTDLLAVKNLYHFGILKEVLERYNAGKPLPEWALTDNIFLAAVAGPILLGIGLGIIFRFKGSTGGTDIPVAILKKYYNMSITNGYLVIETGIIILIGTIFKDPNLIIWGFFTLFISSRTCDIASEGLPYVKGAHIITTQPDAIKKEIFDRLDRGVTILHGEGGYTGDPKDILMCAIDRGQVSMLRDIVRRIDPEAFVIMNDISDVLGYGFRSRHLEMGDASAENKAKGTEL